MNNQLTTQGDSIPQAVMDAVPHLLSTNKSNRTPDRTGRTYGNLTVLKFSHYIPDSNKNRASWHCYCDLTDSIGVVRASALERGTTKTLRGRTRNNLLPKSKVAGVRYNNSKRKWMAYIDFRVDRKHHSFCLRSNKGFTVHDTAEEAGSTMNSFYSRYEGLSFLEALDAERSLYIKKGYYRNKAPSFPAKEDGRYIRNGKIV